MTQNWQILLPAILAGNFLFLPANSIFHLHLAGKMALWHTMLKDEQVLLAEIYQ